MLNHGHSRRAFLGLTGAGIAVRAGLAAHRGGCRRAQDADLVVFNAKVYTVDSRAPKAEAFAVKAGKFTAVGSTADMKALIGKGTQTFDAKQMTVVPGFIDCHNHAHRQRVAVRSAGRQSLCGRVCHHRQHRRKASREGRADAAGHLGGRIISSTTPR